MLTMDLKTTVFQCSKNYGSPTHVIRLKVALNIADPTRINGKRPFFNGNSKIKFVNEIGNFYVLYNKPVKEGTEFPFYVL